MASLAAVARVVLTLLPLVQVVLAQGPLGSLLGGYLGTSITQTTAGVNKLLCGSLGLPVSTVSVDDPAAPIPALPSRNTYNAELLYVWTGDDDRQQPDFLAIFDFNRSSPTYGKLVNKVPLSGCSAFGNEPHHLTFSVDYNRVAAAGILSFLFPFSAGIPLQQQVYFFDTTNPTSPKQIQTVNPSLSGAADELYPLADGSFLLSSLSTRAGTAFGRLTKITRDGNVVQEYPVLPPLSTTNPLSLDGLVNGNGDPIETADLVNNLGILSLDTLNVHGIAVNEEWDIIVTTDFIEPASALVATQAVYNGVRYQPTFRLWKLSTFEIIYTWVTLPGSGNLVVHAVPNDPKARFIGSGVHANKLYLLDPDVANDFANPTWSVLIDFDLLGLPASDPHYFILGQKGQGFLTLNAADKIVYFNFTDLNNVTIVSIYDQPAGSNPHYLAFYPGGLGGTSSVYDNRFVVVNYFLDFKEWGIIHRPGSKIVNVFQWNDTAIFPDPLWKNLDFKTLFPENGVTNPHGTTYYYPESLYPTVY